MNGHATTLVNLTWHFIFRLKTIASFMSSFAFTILIVSRFAKMEFWLQWITMVNVMTFNATMLTFFGIWKYRFGCRCLTLVCTLLFHVKTSISPTCGTHWPCFSKKDGEGQKESLLTSSHSRWPLIYFFGILLGGHGDNNFTNFHIWNSKSILTSNFDFMSCPIWL